jgi:aminoglycoside phosphotransferase (APT) family kinase protein
MIPQEKSAAVTRALQEAFGISTFEDIRRLTGGHTSSHVFRIIVRGSPYVLKIIMRTDDPTRHFTCMKAAAEAGLAPQVWYTSIEDRLAITGFVDAVPLPVTDARTRIPATLRALHALPPFPGVPNHINTTCMFLINKGPAADGFLQRFQTVDILPESEKSELLARYAQLAAVYPHHDADMVSSHNDLFKPDNILFDGNRVWLVDWEATFLNDRYADLAVVANLIVTNEAEEKAYLEEYFGQPADEYQRARFFLMQQIAHMFYAIAFLVMGSAGRQLNLSENAPEFADFQRRIWAGEVSLSDNEMKLVYARVYWKQVLQNMRQARFDEALRLVCKRHTPS